MTNTTQRVDVVEQLHRRLVDPLLLFHIAHRRDQLLLRTLATHIARAALGLHLLAGSSVRYRARSLRLNARPQPHFPRGRKQLKHAPRVQPPNHAELSGDVRRRDARVARHREDVWMMPSVVLRVGGDQILGAVVGPKPLVLLLPDREVVLVNRRESASHVG